MNFTFDYFIWSTLSEGDLVNNGTTNGSKGWQFSMGPYWKFWKWLFTSLDFYYNTHSGTFNSPDPAAGTRTDAADGATSSDSFLGLILAIGVNL